MQILVGTVKGSEIGKNKDGDANVRLLQVQLTDQDDVQTIEQVPVPGDDSSPAEGSKVIVLAVSSSYKVAFVMDDEIDPSAEPGERKLYSSDGGSIQAFIYIRKDGTLELNGNGDNAVRFSKLKEAFDDLKEQWDTFASAYVPGGPTATGTPASAEPSTTEIDPAKIDEIEVP